MRFPGHHHDPRKFKFGILKYSISSQIASVENKESGTNRRSALRDKGNTNNTLHKGSTRKEENKHSGEDKNRRKDSISDSENNSIMADSFSNAFLDDSTK